MKSEMPPHTANTKLTIYFVDVCCLCGEFWIFVLFTFCFFDKIFLEWGGGGGGGGGGGRRRRWGLFGLLATNWWLQSIRLIIVKLTSFSSAKLPEIFSNPYYLLHFVLAKPLPLLVQKLLFPVVYKVRRRLHSLSAVPATTNISQNWLGNQSIWIKLPHCSFCILCFLLFFPCFWSSSKSLLLQNSML